MRKHFLDRPYLYKWTLAVAKGLPRPVLYAFARLTGAVVFFFSGGDRRSFLHNLSIIFNGGKPPMCKRILCWRLFRNYSFYMVDFFRLFSMAHQDGNGCVQLYDGREHLDAALAKGKGVVLLTAHLGHWEIGGLGLRALGYPINVVVIKHNSFFTNSLINTMRTLHGIRVIELGDSIYDSIEIVKALQRNEIVAMLGDRTFFDRSERVMFFGREVSVPVGPILLAMTTGASVVPAFSLMEAPGRYRGVIEPALELRNGSNRAQALNHNLGLMVAVFERYIRRYPDQWYQTEPISGSK